MKKYLISLVKNHFVSPLWILLIDMFIAANAFLAAFIIWMGFESETFSVWEIISASILVLLVYLLVFLVTHSYRGVIRHSNYNELKILIIACFLAFVVLAIFETAIIYYHLPLVRVPFLVLSFHFLLTTIFCFAFRIIVKESYTFLTKKRPTVSTLIFGAGDMGQITLEAIRSDKDNAFHVVGFVDDNPVKWNMNLHSIPVQSWEKAIKTGEARGIKIIILAINNISVERKKEITSDCLAKGWKLKVMPSVGSWVNGISNQRQIRDIRIEDILGRKEIKLNLKRISTGLKGKVVMVTGAAGSIGSEIVRQLLRFPIKKILLVDIAESALYNLQQELLLSYYDVPLEIVLTDFTNKVRMQRVFKKHRPNIVYNAAAYKHVPLMEATPYEAIRVNIGGCKVVADLSVEYNVEKFVMVSTDKAVNPTNVMGASKRICEMYIQSMAHRHDVQTSFITTRFGNVLGSNGSVVPLFKKQISQGGPLTVTHPDITRFFMTIPEASQLVLEAGFMGHGGEVFIFDMGEPVKIIDLAKGMIQLAGLKLGEDIHIKYSGLRPGEKLCEELLMSNENNLPTHNEKIMIAKVKLFDYTVVNQMVMELLGSINIEDDWLLVARMKDLVPEFVSNNSSYSVLDKTN